MPETNPTHFHSANTERTGGSQGLRIGFIISAYFKPDMVMRLVHRLHAPQHGFFIHYDLNSSNLDFQKISSALAGFSNVHMLERHRCRWGDFGHVRASLKGIQLVARMNFPYDYIIILTGQDYPIRSNDCIRERLYAANGKSFMEATAWPIPHWEKGRAIRRVAYFHWHLPFSRQLRDLGWPLDWQHISIPMNRQIPCGLHPYFGSSYCYLSRECIRYVHQFLLDHPEYERFFHFAHIPDENFFQTLLMNSPLAGTIETRTLTYVDWSRKPFPAILNKADLPRLREGDFLFGRKFDLNADAEVLDILDAENRAASTSAFGSNVVKERA